jgi:ribosomal protein S18 acetylase RimI-like enzyme
MISYSKNMATLEQVENHLFKCEKIFVPELSTYVDIKEYSEKLFNKAVKFECFDGETLVGLVAAYEGEAKLYVTNVSTDPRYLNKGIGNALMKMSEEFCGLNNLKYIQLEVKPQNQKAILFYEKRGFEIKNIGTGGWGREIIYEKKL